MLVSSPQAKDYIKAYYIHSDHKHHSLYNSDRVSVAEEVKDMTSMAQKGKYSTRIAKTAIRVKFCLSYDNLNITNGLLDKLTL